MYHESSSAVLGGCGWLSRSPARNGCTTERMAPLTLHRDTRTLKWPDFADLVNAYKSAQPGSVIDMNYFKVCGSVNGLNVTTLSGCKSTWDKNFVLDKEGVSIINGTIDLPDNVGLLVTASTSFENVTITGKGLKWHRRLDPYVVRVTSGAHVSFEECIVESESNDDGHALLVDNRAVCVVSGTRVYGGNFGGNAIKVSGGAALIRKRSVIQGGVIVTAPQSPPTLTVPATRPSQANVPAPTPSPEPVAVEQQTSKEAAGQVQAQNSGYSVTTADEPGSTELSPREGAASSLPFLSSRSLYSLRGATSSAAGEAVQELEVEDHGSAMQHLEAELESNSSSVELKSSEIRQGTAAVYATGSGTRVTVDSCTLAGQTFSLLAAHGARVEVTGSTLIDAATAAASISSGAHLEASTTVFVGQLLGITVERKATAQLTRCTLVSRKGGSSNTPLPPPPKPGFLPDPNITPGVAEVRGEGSVLQAFDCTYGRDNAALPKEIAGGVFLREDGVAAATA